MRAPLLAPFLPGACHTSVATMHHVINPGCIADGHLAQYDQEVDHRGLDFDNAAILAHKVDDAVDTGKSTVLLIQMGVEGFRGLAGGRDFDYSCHCFIPSSVGVGTRRGTNFSRVRTPPFS